MGCRGTQARPACAARGGRASSLSRIVRTPLARRDLHVLALYIGRRDSAAAARLLDRIDDVLRLLADHPQLGPERSTKSGARTFVVRPYVVLYQPIDGGIRLDRVLHGSRDLAALLRGR